MNIFVANIAFQANEQDLQSLFSQHGAVESTKIITDRETGKSKGFGFVKMASVAEGTAAINALNQSEFKGRTLGVNEAKPKD